ncbi:pentapeptide repeat-containing protein [Streptomyces massasporeus]|uniref:pentapeptide repeat-containing protein n=1 Tax=Streptomyces massasporeus TaxID=67324 RepID=UPI0036A8A3DC
MWLCCGHGADAEDLVGCRGVQVPGHIACLAHLTETDRDTYLDGLTPGADIDHRGTPFTEPLLEALLRALHDPTIGKPHFGASAFQEAQFYGDASFREAQFSGTASFHRAEFFGDAVFVDARFLGDAGFHRAQFSGDALFDEARFSGDAEFDEVQFSGEARFYVAQFSGHTSYDAAQFSGDARFYMAKFSGEARFRMSQFSGDVWLHAAQFSDDANFYGTRFAAMPQFGPVLCAREVDLSGAVFDVPVTLEIAARRVWCVRTRWESTATLRLRYAIVDLSDAVLSLPVAVIAHPAPFTVTDTAADESLLEGADSGVRVTSVGGLDAMHLVLTDIDLSDCLFSGAFHLDQLRLEGRCTFALTPTSLQRRIRLSRWTRRRTLAEEHHWRAQSAGQPVPTSYEVPSPRQWRVGPHHPNPDFAPGPEDVAALYRQLRKAFEDGKNEPGAADFYYGEMEMRRHDHTGTPLGERLLLWGYWLLSGYGLRALRALGWLAAAMLVTIVLLMRSGLPNDSPRQEAVGTVPSGGGKVTFEISKNDPQNPTGDRFTGKRFEKSLNVTLNSVVFRSSGQDLTTTGTYIEMGSRVAEPVLLGLAVLAVRNRVKR